MRGAVRSLRPALAGLVRLSGQLHTLFALRFDREAYTNRRRAQRLASVMLAEFNRLGFQKRVDAGGRGRRNRRIVRQRVKFDYPLLLTKEELWCPIDLSRLPYGIKTDDLLDESVLRSMEDRLNASVKVDRLASGKICFVVRTTGNKFPAVYSINAAAIPPDAAPLTIPLGVNADGDPVLVNLVDCKHLLVAGSTGGGKTTFQHAMLTTLLQRNHADELELWLIDMKRAEFALYRPLMGKQGDGIVRYLAVEPTDAVEALDQCFREIDRRNKLMERHGATNLEDLRKVAGIRLKRIVLVVDEFAILTTDSTRLGRESIGSITTRLMTRIASLGRSAGVSIIIATQMINKDVMSGMIRANFENRLCFSTADWRQSQLVVESSDADGIPTGRAILRLEGRATEVQTAYITPRQVRVEVSRVAEFGPTGTGADQELELFVRQAQLLITAACGQLAGDFARDRLLQLEGIRGVISQQSFNEIASRLERDGILTPAGTRNKPRRVSQGFFNRANLLPTFYGLTTSANDTQTTSSHAALSFDETDSSLGQQEAAKPAPADSTDVVCRLETDSTHEAPADGGSEPDPEEPDIGPFEKYIR